MAKLREIENFKGDYYNPAHYNSDDKEELKDNILFLIERIESNEYFADKNEALEHLKDMMKNYHGNVILDFLD